MLNQKRGSAAVISLLLMVFIDSLGWGVVFPVLTPLLINNSTGIFPAGSTLTLRNFWFECIIAVYCIFMFLGSPVLGSLSDRYGRKIILMVSLSGLGIGFGIGAIGVWLKSLVLIVIGRIVSGATAGSMPIAQAGIVDISTPDQVAKRMGLTTLAGSIGFSCGPVIGGIFLDQHLWSTINYQVPFWVATGVAFIGVFFIQFMFTDTFKPNKETQIKLLTGIKNIYEAFVWAKTKTYFLGLLLFFTGWAQFFTTMPIFVTGRFHLTGSWLGYFMFYFSVIFSIGSVFVLPRLTMRFNLKNIVLYSLIVQFIFYIAFGLSHHGFLLWLFIIPIALTGTFGYVGLVTLIANNTDSQHQGKAMGVTGSVAAFAWAVGPMLSGLISGFSPFVSQLFATFLIIIAAWLIFNSEKLLRNGVPVECPHGQTGGSSPS